MRAIKSMKHTFSVLVAAAIFTTASLAKTAAPVYTILTLKNGQQISKRVVNSAELHNAAIELTIAFQARSPDYSILLGVAKGMTAKDRCFNLYSSRTALASVQGGILDASANSEEFLRRSIKSIEEVNNQTQVTCEMK